MRRQVAATLNAAARGTVAHRRGPVPYLGDRHGLLLHDLVEDAASRVAHLVELVDAADTIVSEHQGTGLQDQLLGLSVLGDISSQTHCAGTLARRVL